MRPSLLAECAGVPCACPPTSAGSLRHRVTRDRSKEVAADRLAHGSSCVRAWAGCCWPGEHAYFERRLDHVVTAIRTRPALNSFCPLLRQDRGDEELLNSCVDPEDTPAVGTSCHEEGIGPALRLE
jgi:hypothetical protein